MFKSGNEFDPGEAGIVGLHLVACGAAVGVGDGAVGGSMVPTLRPEGVGRIVVVGPESMNSFRSEEGAERQRKPASELSSLAAHGDSMFWASAWEAHFLNLTPSRNSPSFLTAGAASE